MLHKPSHDDRVRAARIRLANQRLPATAPLADVPIEVTPKLVRRVLRPAVARTEQREWQQRTQGGMKAFLRHARAVQNLPSFARSMRE